MHRKYKYFRSSVQTAKDRLQKMSHFCRLAFNVTSGIISRLKRASHKILPMS